MQIYHPATLFALDKSFKNFQSPPTLTIEKPGWLIMQWSIETESTLWACRVTRGRCYDHNFLRFLPIFCEKIGVFSKTNVMINFLHNLHSFVLSKKHQFFCQIFRRKYHNTGPRLGDFSTLGRLFKYFEHFFQDFRRRNIFGLLISTLKVMYSFLQNMGRASFWAIFSQTNPVTLMRMPAFDQ
jgi:hypothetical protein